MVVRSDHQNDHVRLQRQHVIGIAGPDAFRSVSSNCFVKQDQVRISIDFQRFDYPVRPGGAVRQAVADKDKTFHVPQQVLRFRCRFLFGQYGVCQNECYSAENDFECSRT